MCGGAPGIATPFSSLLNPFGNLRSSDTGDMRDFSSFIVIKGALFGESPWGGTWRLSGSVIAGCKFKWLGRLGGSEPPPLLLPSMYSSPLSRFYPHPGMGPHPHAFAPHHHFSPHHHHNAHTLGGILPEHSGAPSSQGPQSQQPPPNTHPGLGDGNATKPEMIPNPLQSLREVKVPGYPAFDTNAPTSVASVTSVSPFPTTTSNHQNAEKVPKKEEFSSSSAAERRGSIGEISNNERERDSKNKSPKTNSSSSSANSTPSSQPPPISAAMGSTTMTTPAGPQGPIVHPNIHLPPTSGAPPFPGAFHPHPHPIHPLYQFPYAPYFSPYAPYFPGPPPQPGGPPGPIPRMPPIPPQQGVRSSSPQAGQSVNGLVKGNNENSPSNSSSSGQGQSQSQSSSHGHHHHHHGSSSSSKSKHGHSSSSSSHGSRSNPEPVEDPDDAEETPSPHGVPRGPSPEAKVEDSECHRSQSAIFIRRLARGSSDGSYFNSCARTDLTFKPVPESKLARKREERLRKQVEKEREERERAAQARKQLSTPDRDKRETPKPGTTNSGSMGQGMPGQGLPPPGNGDPHFDPRFTPRPPGAFGDTPALRQLSDFARPHTGFSPGRPSGMLPPLPLDQMLGASPYNMSLYGQAAARERMEMEALEKREREIREIRERELSDRLKEEFLRNVPGAPGHPPSTPVSAPGPGGPPRLPNPLESHFMDIHRRYSALGGPGGPPLSQLHQSGFGLYPPSNAPPTSTLSPLERERLERLGIPSSLPQLGNDPLLTERLHAERLMAADMNMRLQLAASAAGAGGSGYPGMDHLAAAYASRQPQLIPPRDSGPLGLHPAEMLGRAGYPPELAHHISAHEQLQRQMMMDRERFNHPGAGGAPPGLAPHFLAQQQEEYLRQQQRDREMKIRTLEEAARRH